MSSKGTLHHRHVQHEHALERLRERYWPDATHEDVVALRDLARELSPSVKALPFTDTKQMFLRYRGRLVHVVYVPRHNAIRTVLPCSALVLGKS